MNVAGWPALTVVLTGPAVIVGATVADVTVSVAEPLVADPATLRTMTKYVLPLSESDAEAIEYVGLFAAPGAAMLLVAVPFFHSKLKPCPTADTVNVAGCPASTDVPCGSAEMVGATAGGVTVTNAVPLEHFASVI